MSLEAALRRQAGACAELGSAFTARLLTLVADRLTPGTPVADRLLGWTGELGASGQSVPLRLAGSLHGLVLSGAAPALAALYPPNDPPSDDALWRAVSEAMVRHEARLMSWLDRPPQTNEVGRSAALIPAAHWLAGQYGLPLRVSELGASAGLNLNWDRYALETPGGRLGPEDAVLTLAPGWQGMAPAAADPVVADRRGVDLTPLDPTDPADVLRLCAYVWPDQAERLARMRAALGAMTGMLVDAGDAADWLERRLATPWPGQLHLIYHTIAWQYFPADRQAHGRALIEAAGAAATPEAPLAWLAMEADDQPRGAGLTLRLWPGDRHVTLGRVDFHGRWIDWQPAAAD